MVVLLRQVLTDAEVVALTALELSGLLSTQHADMIDRLQARES